MAKRLISGSAVLHVCMRVNDRGSSRAGRGGVIGALECNSATRLPDSTPMNPWLRPEPTQLLQGIVGKAITEISTSDECFDPE